MLLNIELWILTPFTFADPYRFSRWEAGKPKFTILNYSWMPELQVEKYCRLEAGPTDALSVYITFQCSELETKKLFGHYITFSIY